MAWRVWVLTTSHFRVATRSLVPFLLHWENTRKCFWFSFESLTEEPANYKDDHRYMLFYLGSWSSLLQKNLTKIMWSFHITFEERLSENSLPSKILPKLQSRLHRTSISLYLGIVVYKTSWIRSRSYRINTNPDAKQTQAHSYIRISLVVGRKCSHQTSLVANFEKTQLRNGATDRRSNAKMRTKYTRPSAAVPDRKSWMTHKNTNNQCCDNEKTEAKTRVYTRQGYVSAEVWHLTADGCQPSTSSVILALPSSPLTRSAQGSLYKFLGLSHTDGDLRFW